MAQVFGLDVDTIARGRNELLGGQVLRGRVRRAGAGRPAVEKNAPHPSPAARLAPGGYAPIRPVNRSVS